MAWATGVSLKTENEEYAGKTVQLRVAKGGGEVSSVPVSWGFDGEFPGSPPPASPMAQSRPLWCGIFVVLFLERPPWPLSVIISKS